MLFSFDFGLTSSFGGYIIIFKNKDGTRVEMPSGIFVAGMYREVWELLCRPADGLLKQRLLKNQFRREMGSRAVRNVRIWVSGTPAGNGALCGHKCPAAMI
jgi:hypothetical protein